MAHVRTSPGRPRRPLPALLTALLTVLLTALSVALVPALPPATTGHHHEGTINDTIRPDSTHRRRSHGCGVIRLRFTSTATDTSTVTLQTRGIPVITIIRTAAKPISNYALPTVRPKAPVIDNNSTEDGTWFSP